MSNSSLVPVLHALHMPLLVQAAGERAQTRFWEIFVSNICNPNTRRAYAHAVFELLTWCEQHGIVSIADVQSLHVGRQAV